MGDGPNAGHSHMEKNTIGLTPATMSTYLKAKIFCKQHCFITSAVTQVLSVGIFFLCCIQFVIAWAAQRQGTIV